MKLVKPISFFTIWLFAFTGIAFGGVMALKVWIPMAIPASTIIGLLLFFFFSTLLVHLIMLFASEYNPQESVTFFIGAIVLKLLVSIAFVVLMAFKYDQHLFELVVLFFIMYILYTSFEIFFTLSFIRLRDRT